MIEYKNITEEDIPKLTDVIGSPFVKEGKTENSEAYLKFVDYIILKHLSRANFARAAFDGRTIVGFIAGRINKEHSPSLNLDFEKRMDDDLAVAKGSPKWAKKIRYIAKLDEAKKGAMERHADEFDAELITFGVDDGYREQGIGKQLIEDFRNFILEKGARNFYVFTTYFNEKFHGNTGFVLVEKVKVKAIFFKDDTYLCKWEKTGPWHKP